jgi:hypothetical protein
MKKITLLLLTAFCWQINAQILIEESLDNGTPATWTSSSYNTNYSASYTCEGTRSIYNNMYDSASNNGTVTSNNYVGASNNTDATVSFEWLSRPYSSNAVDYIIFVEYSTDDGSSWNAITQFAVTESNSCTIYSETISAANLPSGSDFKFQIRGEWQSGDSYFYLDNIFISQAIACPAPSDLTATSITTTQAQLGWIENGSAMVYNVEVVAEGTTATGTATDSGVPNGFTKTGLASATDYEYYVQVDCGGGDLSLWAGPFSFTTLCDAVTAFPWTEDFEGITTPSLPPCWSEKNNNADFDSWITYTYYGTSDSNSASLYTDYNSGANDDYLILPQFALTGNERLKFSVRSRSSGEPNDYKVVLSTSSNAPTDFTTDLMALTEATATHTEQIIDLSAYSGNVYIAIHVPADGLDGYYLYVDDFTVEAIPSCEPVIDLATSILTNTSADLSWTAGATQTTWNIQYGATDFALGAGTTVAVTANSYALMGLTANTSYDFYVQADCDANGFSAWVGPETFTTEPDPIVPNYTNDFSSISDGFWSFGYGALTSSPVIPYADTEWFLSSFGNDFTDGSDSAAINLYANLNEWLISSTFDLSGGTYYLNLDAAATEYYTTDDAIFGTDIFATLMTSTDGGSTWNELYRWNADNNPGADGTSMPEIELTGYTASSKFAIYAESSTSNISDDIDFFADNFSITATSLGMDTLSTSNFTYFPNPVNNVLSIKAQASIDSITVYNMLGQTVVRSTPNTTTTTVDMSGLQTGAYFVQVAINNSIETVRVIKN